MTSIWGSRENNKPFSLTRLSDSLRMRGHLPKFWGTPRRIQFTIFFFNLNVKTDGERGNKREFFAGLTNILYYSGIQGLESNQSYSFPDSVLNSFCALGHRSQNSSQKELYNKTRRVTVTFIGIRLVSGTEKVFNKYLVLVCHQI